MDANTEPASQGNTRILARLALKYITLDTRLQSRELKPAVVKEYAHALKRGETLPPVVVVRDGKGHYYLVDGHHRIAARRELVGMDEIEVEVIEGTFTDALWLSWGANRDHGLRRTQEDKRRAIRAALQHPQWKQKSNRAIARHIGCDHKTVIAMRRIVAAGHFPTAATDRPPTPLAGPSKDALLSACRLLAGMQAEQGHQLDPQEIAVVRAGYERLRYLLNDDSSFRPNNPKKVEEQSEGVKHVIN